MPKPIRKKRVKVKSNKYVNVTFDYKDIGLLAKFVTEQGAIVGRAETGLSRKQQNRLTTAVKRARHLALLPFTQTYR